MIVCFTIDQTYLHGGIEKVLATKANYFADVLHYEVYIITTHQNRQAPQYSLSANIKLIDLNIPYNRNISYFSWQNLKLVPKHFKQLQGLLKDIKPDIWIVCHYAVDFFFNPLIAKKLRIPVVKEYHGSAYKRKENNSTKSWLDKLQYKVEQQYDALVLLNEGERAFYQHKHIVVIPNPQEALPTQSDVAANKVLAAGRVAPIKNFGRLIKVWQQIHSRFPNWELDIWGPDYLGTTAVLEVAINEAGLASVVHLKGAIADLSAVMHAYSIYAMSSDSECFPMVLLEAQSVGMPMISFDVPTGPKYIIKDGETGYLVPNDDMEMYQAQLSKMMQDITIRQSMQLACIKESEQYLPKAIMPQWVQLINDLKHD